MSLHQQQQYKERDSKGEYLFRACSVATNLVKSPELAFLLCEKLWLKNFSLFLHWLDA